MDILVDNLPRRYLEWVADELGLFVEENMTAPQIKDLIVSNEFEEEWVTELFEEACQKCKHDAQKVVMDVFARRRKPDLLWVATQIGIAVEENMTGLQLKELIAGSESDEERIRELLEEARQKREFEAGAEKRMEAEREKQRAQREKERAEREKQRAQREKERAEKEKERAEREKQRAHEEKQREHELELERLKCKIYRSSKPSINEPRLEKVDLRKIFPSFYNMSFSNYSKTNHAALNVEIKNNIAKVEKAKSNRNPLTTQPVGPERKTTRGEPAIRNKGTELTPLLEKGPKCEPQHIAEESIGKDCPELDSLPRSTLGGKTEDNIPPGESVTGQQLSESALASGHSNRQCKEEKRGMEPEGGCLALKPVDATSYEATSTNAKEKKVLLAPLQKAPKPDCPARDKLSNKERETEGGKLVPFIETNVEKRDGSVAFVLAFSHSEVSFVTDTDLGLERDVLQQNFSEKDLPREVPTFEATLDREKQSPAALGKESNLRTPSALALANWIEIADTGQVEKGISGKCKFRELSNNGSKQSPPLVLIVYLGFILHTPRRVELRKSMAKIVAAKLSAERLMMRVPNFKEPFI